MVTSQTQVSTVSSVSRAGWNQLRSIFRGAPPIPIFIAFVLITTAVLSPVLIDLLPTRTPNCPGDACLKNPEDKYNPEAGNLAEKHYPPMGFTRNVRGIGEVSGDSHHIMGTDRLGRDVLARLIQGGRMSLTIACLSIVISAFIGTALGLMAGYYGRWVDALLMRAVDLSLAFPAVLLALVFAVTFGPNFWWVVVVLVLIRWAHFARLVRGETLALKERDFVALSQVAGAPVYRIVGVHIFPNLVNSIVVLATLHVGSAIIVEATLSFLGAGVPPPTPTWGEMIAGDRQFVRTAWWVSTAAGLAIALTVLSFNLMGDWLRDRLDPSLRTL